LNEVSGGIIEYYIYCPSSGNGDAGTSWFGGKVGEGKYVNTNYTNSIGDQSIHWKSWNGDL